jgi:hypothetical protein
MTLAKSPFPELPSKESIEQHNPLGKKPLVLMQNLAEDLASTLGLSTLYLLLTELLLGESSGVGVEAELDLLVAERVLLLRKSTLGDGSTTDGAEHLLDFGGVDELAEIGLLHDGRREEEVLLQGRGLGGGAVDLVQSSESGRGPDDETAKVTTGSQLEKVEGIDGGSLNTGDVAESKDQLFAILIGVVDDKRSTALPVAATPHLTLTSTELAGVSDLLDVGTSSDLLEKGKSGGSLGDGTVGEGSGGDDKRDFRDGGDLVSTGHQQSSAGRGSKRGSSSEALLSQVDLDVPLAPDLGGSEHTTGTALITKGSLTSTVGSATRDTRNTCDSATSSP